MVEQKVYGCVMEMKMTALMRERYLVDFCRGNALCYLMDGLDSNPISIASY